MSSREETTPVNAGPRAVGERRKKLGRGLGALLGESRREEPLIPRIADPARSGIEPASGAVGGGEARSSMLAMVPIAAIEPLPGQPRSHFDEDSLVELAASIAARGVIQPVIVRRKANGRFQLVAGERRWRAAQKAHLHEIPALVRELSDREVMALALIENLQREDLNPVEEARAYQRLSEQEGMTQAEIAQMVEKSRSHIANLLRLLSLPAEVLDLVEGGQLSMGHARALIGHERALELAREAAQGKLSVREIEQRVREGNAQGKVERKQRTRTPSPENADIAAVEAHLEEFLGLTVRIKPDGDPRSGAVTIRYRTLDQLDLICQRLTGGEL